MVTCSRTSNSSSNRSKEKENVAGIQWILSQFQKQVEASRLISVREKVLKNRKNLELHTLDMFELAKKKEEDGEPMESDNFLSARLTSPLCRLSTWEQDKESANSQEEISAPASIVFGSSCGGKSVVCLNKLPFVDKIPPYTSWIFLNRNQRMAEDQSVLGRRQIYYDPYGNETLICSDSEEEILEPEDEKHDFSEGEDQILWKAIQQYGINEEVIHFLCHSIEVTPEEIKERYETLFEKCHKNDEPSSEASNVTVAKPLLDKTLSASLDSFDNLFCRRCLIFDCRRHGCSQNLITSSEKQPYGADSDEKRKPCSEQCFLRIEEKVKIPFHAEKGSTQTKKIGAALPSESENLIRGDDVTSLSASEGLCYVVNNLTIISSENSGSSKRKILKHEISLEKSQTSSGKHGCPADKKQKKLLSSDFSPPSRDLYTLETVTDAKYQSGPGKFDQLHHEFTGCPAQTNDDLFWRLSSSRRELVSHWSVIEKDLYLKGTEIFGKNSCLIARNLLSGLKTCMEVSKYMFSAGASLQTRSLITNSCVEDSGRCANALIEQDLPARTRIWRKRGRAKKLKYTWKTTGHPSIRKRIGDGKQQPCKQYTPCGCQQMCGKQCSCLENETCCEKYCGCSKSCKNRFRGCHCAKSQCRSRQCPVLLQAVNVILMYAEIAGQVQCCGRGSLDDPQSTGDGYHCGNMKLLLKQQQRILLARSDVAGWGAFIRVCDLLSLS
ncbi:Histone-lysine N-methyltransferase EZ3 [Platanthera guangdongensis]|uniref:Histone-lysine N-methyltransferase EZ3 n=1 Tax=Platanthera guangdongensis TaxID=2320717 RepID=A0ABR2M9M3_9ASPA